MSKPIDSVTNGKATGLIVQREGEGLVLTDPNGKQYACTTPEELWDDVLSILGDRELPKMLVAPGEDPRRSPGATVREPGGDEFMESFFQQAGQTVGEAYGPFFGQLAEKVARRGAPAGLSFLKKISRNSKRKVAP